MTVITASVGLVIPPCVKKGEPGLKLTPGIRRFERSAAWPAALITLGSLAIFAALASMLHSRDKKVWEARGLPTSSKA